MNLTKDERNELEELAAAYQEHKQMGSEWNDGFYEGIKFAVEYVEKQKKVKSEPLTYLIRQRMFLDMRTKEYKRIMNKA